MTTISIGPKLETALEKEGLSFNAPAAAVAQAILNTVVKEGIVQEILAGIEVSDFIRGRGRPKSKTQKTPTPRQYKMTINGRPANLAELSAMHGVPISTIRSRLKRGIPVEVAVSMKNQNFKANRGER